MNTDEFESVVNEQVERSVKIMLSKAKEYSTDVDRLDNFKKAAHLQGITVEQALGGMMAKHTYSIFAMIQDGKYHPVAVWDEKISDHINYLLLLRAIVEEGIGVEK